MHKYVLLLFFCIMSINAQKGLSIPVAKEQGITVEHLDSVYKTALQAESSKLYLKYILSHIQDQKANFYCYYFRN